MTDGDLAKLMREILGDAYRPGAPTTFSAEQVAQIISVACEPPSDHDLRVSHWTPRELRAVVFAVRPGAAELLHHLPETLPKVARKAAPGSSWPEVPNLGAKGDDRIVDAHVLGTTSGWSRRQDGLERARAG